MAARYQAVQWTRKKAIYDAAIGVGIALYVTVFIAVARATGSVSADTSPQILIISALGACAFFMLHVVLAIGPLGRLSPVFLPLLYNRRHLSVSLFLVALAHGSYATVWYHAYGVLNPLVSLFASNPSYDAIGAFPFESLGAFALLILFVRAATSHDFWLRTLSPVVWKCVHMLIYAAYALAVLHVLLGTASGQGGNALYVWTTAAGFALIAGLHIAAGVKFYVGYRSMPQRLRLSVGGLVSLLLVLVGFDAWLVASMQPPAGNGSAAERPQEYVGTLSREPYPMLRVNTPDGLKTYLLVSEEKRGAEAALGVTPNGPVKLTGFLIARANVGMIELAASDVAVIAETQTIAEPARELHGTVTIEGEIVDSKCWLGAMRPGEGHLHKACASLCIRGGIPPMFVTRGAGATPSVMLLTQTDGRAVPPDLIIPYVGDAVRVSGTIEKRADLWVFKADLPTIAPTR